MFLSWIRRPLWAILIAALVAVLAMPAALSAKPGVQPAHSNGGNGASQTALQNGWDLYGEPLVKGKVIWNAPDSQNRLQLTFIVEGARPNHIYQVGLVVVGTLTSDLFTGDPFGILFASGTVVREVSQPLDLTNWDLGFVATDALGNGSAHFEAPANSGSFDVQFFVRQGVGCPASNCGVVFESEGVFGTTVLATIR